MSFPTTLLSNIHHVLPHRTSPLVLPSGGNPTCGQWARRGAASGCLLVSRYLHRTPPGPHIQSHTHTLPLHPTTLHSHLPDHTPTPHSHLYFGYKQTVPGAQLGFVPTTVKDITTLIIHTNHSTNTHKHPNPTPLDKVYTRTSVIPSSTPHQRTFVCGDSTVIAQVGVALVSLFNSLFKKPSLYCLDVCLMWYL